jgi:uncharacterized Zn-binding protein involved in type VI secretion
MNRLARTTGFLVFMIVAATSAPAGSGQAARVGDNHTCPLITTNIPHDGGPVLPPGVPNVLIGGKPAAVVGNPVQCKGPLDSIVKGSSTVRIGGKPAARSGDLTAHGGTITSGCANVMIGD